MDDAPAGEPGPAPGGAAGPIAAAGPWPPGGARPAAGPPGAARAAVALLFLLLGTTMGSWLSRAPDVKARVGLDDAAWGAALVGTTVGSFLALALVALLINRAGPRRLVLLAAPGLLVVGVALTASSRPALLAAMLVLFGLSASLLNTPMNAQAVAVERAYGRPVMSSFHACYSLGTLLGALLGSAAAALEVHPALQLLASGAVLAGLLAAAVAHLPVDPPPVPAEDQAPRRFTPGLLLLAAMALCALLAESTASGWSAIYVSQALGGGGALGAVAYACFAGTMSTGRVLGDRVARRLGRRRFLQASGAVAAAGLGLGLSIPTPLVACLGFALLGAGLSCVIPNVYGLAGNQPGVSPGAGIATVTISSWPAFLVGPPLIGLLSSQTSLRAALLLVVAAAAVIALLAGRLGGGDAA